MKENLELDLLKSEYIVQKCVNDNYAQNLYAALCNNRFLKNNQEWTCSWRYSGGLVADLRNLNEDYMDFYCSGMMDKEGIVGEGTVTDEIREDLGKLGWEVKSYE
jgi:hypothetical protein